MTAIRLKDAAFINAETLPEDTDPRYSFSYVDISQVGPSGRMEIPDEQIEFASSPSRARRVARAGDTVVSTVRTYLRAIARVPPTEHDLVFSTGFAVLSPRECVHGPYLSWACQSEIFVSEVVARSTGVSYPAINPSELAMIRVPLPPLDVQRRIADFLDHQVGRIERTVALRRQQAALESERYTARLSMLFGRTPKVPLRRLARRALVGIVVQPAALYSQQNDAVPALRGMDISEGEINPSPAVRITASGNAANAESQLRPGDVVVVRTGDAGAAAVVPEWAEGWNCIDLVIVRTAPKALPEYLEAAINSARRDKSVAQHAAGSIQQHFGVNAVSGLPVPSIPLPEQRAVVDEVRGARREAAAMRTLCDRSIALLTERKRSLITAAVTGEFDVTAASSRTSAASLSYAGGVG